MNKNKLLESIFYPRKSGIQQDSNDIIIPTSNNDKVSVRTFLANRNNPTILYFHGNAELAQEYDSIAEYYHKYNINLIVADFRGYGLSTGIPTRDNLHHDSQVIFNFVKEHLYAIDFNSTLYIMGRSLGSASAFEIVSKNQSSIAGCIIESGFVTEYPLLNLLNINTEEVDFNLDDGFMNLSKLRTYTGKLLIIHADLDDIVPFSQAELMLIESPSKEKDLFKVSGAGHNTILMIAREVYFTKINEFINK